MTNVKEAPTSAKTDETVVTSLVQSAKIDEPKEVGFIDPRIKTKEVSSVFFKDKIEVQQGLVLSTKIEGFPSDEKIDSYDEAIEGKTLNDAQKKQAQLDEYQRVHDAVKAVYMAKILRANSYYHFQGTRVPQAALKLNGDSFIVKVPKAEDGQTPKMYWAKHKEEIKKMVHDDTLKYIANARGKNEEFSFD